MRSVLVLAILIASTVGQPVKKRKLEELLDPIHKVHDLDEEGFEDYLDKWIEQEQNKSLTALTTQPSSGDLIVDLTISENRFLRNDQGILQQTISNLPLLLQSLDINGCTFEINKHLGQPQPLYIYNDKFLNASSNTGQIWLKKGEQITVACTGSGKLHYPNLSNQHTVATAKCENNNFVSGAGWLTGIVDFGKITCSAHTTPTLLKTGKKCFKDNPVIEVGFNVNNKFYPVYYSCFDEKRMEALYVMYAQTPEHAVHQTRVTRPTWQAGTFYPGVDTSTIYTQAYQKDLFTTYFGANIAKKYITKTKQRFFARGHLAAKSDFVFATAQRSTFYYINAAPQWQCINAGNWNRLEQKLRARIAAAGYKAHIYTGTFGVLELYDHSNKLVKIYLAKGNKVPVPLYFYKVVHDPVKKMGTAFITINNPFITTGEAIAFARQFCDCQCRARSTDFAWLQWDPDNTEIGYSFCCTIENFRKKIPHLPQFKNSSLLL